MFDLNIVTYPARVLRKKSEALRGVAACDKNLMRDMANLMHASKGIGLAAPQVGIPKRIIICDTGEGLIKMANPEILSGSGRDSLEEGCLSVPERTVNIYRADKITVSYIDEKDAERRKVFRGLAARVIQHEIDHLNGRLIIDYLPWYKKIFPKKGNGLCLQ